MGIYYHISNYCSGRKMKRCGCPIFFTCIELEKTYKQLDSHFSPCRTIGCTNYGGSSQSTTDHQPVSTKGEWIKCSQKCFTCFLFYKEYTCIWKLVLVKDLDKNGCIFIKLCSFRWKKWIQTLVKVPECCLAWWGGRWWQMVRVYWYQLSNTELDWLAD